MFWFFGKNWSPARWTREEADRRRAGGEFEHLGGC